MPSRRAVLAGIGSASALSLAGCSSLGFGSDDHSAESHLVSTSESLHPDASSEPDGLFVNVDAYDIERRRTALEEAGFDPDSLDVRSFERDSFDPITGNVGVRSEQVWADGRTVVAQYEVGRGEASKAELKDEYRLPTEPDGEHAGYDTYHSERSSIQYPQRGVSDSASISVYAATSTSADGSESQFDVLTTAIDAAEGDAQVSNWLADPIDELGSAYRRNFRVRLPYEASEPDSARFSTTAIEGSTVEDTVVLAMPDAETFEEHWDESRLDFLLENDELNPELEVRDRLAIATTSRPVEERF